MIFEIIFKIHKILLKISLAYYYSKNFHYFWLSQWFSIIELSRDFYKIYFKILIFILFQDPLFLSLS